MRSSLVCLFFSSWLMLFILVFPSWEVLWIVCLFVSSWPMLFIVSPLHFAWFVSGSRSFICCYLVADVIHCTVLLPGFFAISISLRGLPVFSLSICFVPRYRRFIALLYIFSKATTLLQFFRHEKFFGLFVCFSWPMLFIVFPLHFACFVSGSISFLCCCLIADVIHCTFLAFLQLAFRFGFACFWFINLFCSSLPAFYRVVIHFLLKLLLWSSFPGMRSSFIRLFPHGRCYSLHFCYFYIQEILPGTMALASFSLCFCVPASNLLFCHYYWFFPSLYYTFIANFFPAWEVVYLLLAHGRCFLLLCCCGLSRGHFNIFVFPAWEVFLFVCSLHGRCYPFHFYYFLYPRV